MSKLGALQLTTQTGPKNTATVIFFHGSGSCGADMKDWVRLLAKNFSFPHIKILYPTAPLQPYTPSGGAMSNVWFDRVGINPTAPEKLDSISLIEKEVKNLIKNERLAGIPSNRIVVGGFSMGGALALHTAYRWDRNIAGAFVCSSFLNEKSIVYEELKNSSGAKLPPLLQIHGDIDDLVSPKWGLETFDELKALGVRGDYHIIEKVGHSISRHGVGLIKAWIDKLLPE